jgi:hypothetical protein
MWRGEQMKFVMIIVIAMIIAACVEGGPAKPTVKGSDALIRYETPEVVCFSTDGEHSLWCYKK